MTTYKIWKKIPAEHSLLYLNAATQEKEVPKLETAEDFKHLLKPMVKKILGMQKLKGMISSC